MADATDLKSVDRKVVWVRLPPSAPIQLLHSPSLLPQTPLKFFLSLSQIGVVGAGGLDFRFWILNLIFIFWGGGVKKKYFFFFPNTAGVGFFGGGGWVCASTKPFFGKIDQYGEHRRARCFPRVTSLETECGAEIDVIRLSAFRSRSRSPTVSCSIIIMRMGLASIALKQSCETSLVSSR